VLPFLKAVFVGDDRTVRPEDGAITLHNLSINKRAAGPVLDDPLSTMLAAYALRPIIPAPGFYTFELFCENQFMDDQLIEILPAK
jgi:hypothetical protein